jgi:uncharacterized protein
VDELNQYAALCLSAAAAGAVNAIAGGGTLLTFPTLFAALGGSPEAAVLANGTSTVALIPGYLGALGGYRREIEHARRWLLILSIPSLFGGLIGTLLVVWLPAEVFKVLVPWLILSASLLFALQPLVTRWTGIGRPHELAGGSTIAGVALFQFFVAIYGGYFGAGIGILMLAALSIMGLSDIHEMNALKTMLAFFINIVAAVTFIAAGKVHWRFAAAMAVSSVLGGYVGAALSRKIDRRVVRLIIVTIGLTLSSFYFWRQFSSSPTNDSTMTPHAKAGLTAPAGAK